MKYVGVNVKCNYHHNPTPPPFCCDNLQTGCPGTYLLVILYSYIALHAAYQNICQICHIIEIYKLAWDVQGSNIWAQWQTYFIFGPFFHLFSFKFTIFIQYGQIWFYQSFLYLMISIIMLPYPVFRLYFCNLWDCFGSSAIQFIWVCLPAHYFFTYIINGKGDPHSVRVALNRVIIKQRFDTKN